MTRACLIACLALASCRVESEETMLLPWLRAERTERQFGAFPAHSEVRYETKRFGVWWSLDAWEATVLDADHALVRSAAGYAIVRHGEGEPALVCRPDATLTRPPVPGVVDCASGAAQANGSLVEIRFVRLDYAGRTLEDRTLAAVGARRIFPSPARVLFYDAAGTPHFLLMDVAAATDFRRRPTDCALLALVAGEARLVTAPPGASWEDCRSAKSWEMSAGLRLHEAG